MAVIACVSSSALFSDNVVKFQTVESEKGITNINEFKSSGKFVCEIAGMYYISAGIYTNSQGYTFDIKKNSSVVISATGQGGSWSMNPISTVVELQVKDTLHVHTNAYISSSYSCLSILKVK